MIDADPDATRCGFVAIIGAPNAGKSTLLNYMVGAKISIVTHKVQTTRTRIRGVVLSGHSQIIFVDTPGIFEPRRRLDRAMVSAAWRGAADADRVMLLVDAPLYWEARIADSDRMSKRAAMSVADTDRIVDGLQSTHTQAILVLNKIDGLAREKLLAIAAKLQAHNIFTDTYMISALTGNGVDDLKCDLAAQVPLGPWLYPRDQIADLPQRMLASEITREKLTLRVHDELPYVTTVETESWKNQKNGSIRIEQVIYVQRESQRAIILGKGGRTIKEIGSLAREEIQDSLGCRVHLFLFVKVREKWLDDPERYRELGLEFPKK